MYDIYLCSEATPSQSNVAIAASTAEPFFNNIFIPISEHSTPFEETAAYISRINKIKITTLYIISLENYILFSI